MEAIGSSLGIVAYLALFAGVGLLFLFVNLLVGSFVRPHNPHAEKLEIYECGEPTIGSSFVQFDLRFYVVALLFIIFDVEVAFFFPWATVFGKANHFGDPAMTVIERRADDSLQLSADASNLYRELGVKSPQVPAAVPANQLAGFRRVFGKDRVTSPQEAEYVVRRGGYELALLTTIDIFVFFAILMVGFFYVWRRGDLDWVRAVSQQRGLQRQSRAGPQAAEEPALSA